MKHHFLPAVVMASLALVACGSSDDDTPTDPATPDDGTSAPAPDQDVMPLPNEPGGDTRAVAGYWDGSGDDGDERYVVIAENGLWTEYLLTTEGDGATNCYVRLGPQTLAPEDPVTNGYGLGDGRALTLLADPTAEALLVSFADGASGPETWPAVSGRVAEDLPLCQTV